MIRNPDDAGFGKCDAKCYDSGIANLPSQPDHRKTWTCAAADRQGVEHVDVADSGTFPAMLVDSPRHPDSPARPHLLSGSPDLPSPILNRIRQDFDTFATTGLPGDLEAYLLETYGLDVSARYAGIAIRNPWGKASGQLSMRAAQVREAAEAGLGFVVLKTVIAEDGSGGRSMDAWAIREARMVVEPIVGRLSGASGWTVSWKGRGWWDSFDAYLDLIRVATSLARDFGMLIVPSVKYHLPAPDEDRWRSEEYRWTTGRLLEAYPGDPVPIEKDFSPTLAGSERSARRARILEWLAMVPPLIHEAAGPRAIRVGLKLFNALDDEAFQLRMLAAVHGPDRPEYLIYANRLFDPDREFEGHRGIAYGGPDLSDRNLRMLSALRAGQVSGTVAPEPLEIGATGDIGSGRMAVEYALRGCANFQIHTLFQLPAESFPMTRGTKLERALHLLNFHPESGFLAWALHAAQRLGLAGGPGPVRFLDLVAIGARSSLGKLDAQGA